MESVNTVLRKDRNWAKQHHIEFHPQITINNFKYRGDVDFHDIREAICAAYNERPDHCNLDVIWQNEKSHPPTTMELAPEETIVFTGQTIDGKDYVETKEDKSTKKMSMWVVVGIIAII